MRFRTSLLLLLLSHLLPAQSVNWSPAEVLFPNIAQPGSADLGGETSGPYFDAKPDAGNRIHLVWSDGAAGETEILYSKGTTTAFSSPENVSQMPQTASAWPSLAVAADGRIYCAWTELSEDMEGASIFLSFKNPGGNWSSPVLVSDPDADPISIYPSVCVTGTGAVIIAYNSVTFDEVAIDYLFEIQILVFNPSGSVIDGLPSPETDSSSSAFRPIIAADKSGGIHCVWYDGDNGMLPSGRYVAYSRFNGQTWTQTNSISDASEQVWDDLSLQCLTNDAGDLTVLWTSFIPIENQMAVKPLGQGFEPSQTLPFETTNWDAAITSNGDLHFAGDSPEGSLDYAVRTAGSWLLGTPLVSEAGEDGYYPEMAVSNDTLHLFWEEGGQLLHRTKISQLIRTAESVEPALHFFPNPCSEWFQITLPPLSEESQVQVFDANGSLLLEQKIRGKARISVAALSPGTYVLSVVSEGLQRTRTFVKY